MARVTGVEPAITVLETVVLAVNTTPLYLEGLKGFEPLLLGSEPSVVTGFDYRPNNIFFIEFIDLCSSV